MADRKFELRGMAGPSDNAVLSDGYHFINGGASAFPDMTCKVTPMNFRYNPDLPANDLRNIFATYMSSQFLNGSNNFPPIPQDHATNDMRHHFYIQQLYPLAIAAVEKLNLPLTAKVVSVGSGRGQFEATLVKATGLQVIAIDPEPNSFITRDGAQEVEYPPHYKYVKNYLSTDRPATDLLILWWSEYEYDYEAIQLLKPQHILIAYCPDGSAASSQLRAFLHDCKPKLVWPQPYRRSIFCLSESDEDEYEEYDALPIDDLKGSCYTPTLYKGPIRVNRIHKNTWFRVLMLDKKE